MQRRRLGACLRSVCPACGSLPGSLLAPNGGSSLSAKIVDWIVLDRQPAAGIVAPCCGPMDIQCSASAGVLQDGEAEGMYETAGGSGRQP